MSLVFDLTHNRNAASTFLTFRAIHASDCDASPSWFVVLLFHFLGAIMERMTPMELLRLLEAESSTLGVLQSKISNQLHWLKVEEDLLIRKLNNPEHGTTVPSESDEEGRELIEIIEAGSENDEHELQSSGVEQMTTALGETEDTLETTEAEEELEADLLNELLKEDMDSLQEPSPPKKMTIRRQRKQKILNVGDKEDDLETELHAQENNVSGFHPDPLFESPLPLQSIPPQKRKMRGQL